MQSSEDVKKFHQNFFSGPDVIETDAAPGLDIKTSAEKFAEEELRQQYDAEGFVEGTWEAFKAGYKNTYLSSAVKFGDRVKTILEYHDPNFKVADHPEIFEGIREPDKAALMETGSVFEASLVRDQILEAYQRDERLAYQSGASSYLGMLGNLIDVDLPATVLLPEFAWVAKMGRSGRLGAAAATGMKAATVVGGIEAGKVLQDPTGEWGDVVNGAVSGLALGAGLGALAGPRLYKEAQLVKEANEKVDAFHKDFNEQYTPEGSARAADTFAGKIKAEISPEINLEESVGAASLRDSDLVEDLVNADTARMRKEARVFLAKEGVAQKSIDAFPDTPAGRAAESVHKWWNKTPASSSFHRLWDSGSSIAAKAAYQLFESPVGVVRNNKSASNLLEQYQTNILGDLFPTYRNSLRTWLKDRGADKNAPLWFEAQRPANRDAFNRELAIELAHREQGLVSTASAHIKAVADAADASMKRARQVLKGLPGEVPVKGAEELKDASGYRPLKWNGYNMTKLIREGVLTKKQIQNALFSAYKSMHPTWSDDVLNKLALAPLRRGITSAAKADVNMYTMLQEEGVAFTKQYLIDSIGISQKEADKLIEGLRSVDPDKTKVGFLRERTSINLLQKIEGSDLLILDLLDNDFETLFARYSRGAAGTSALARKGYQYVDRNDVINAILDEQNALKAPGYHLSAEDLENMFSYFGGGPISGGVNPWVRRAMQVTGLSIYGAIGLAQAAETGAGIMAVGMHRWTDSLRAVLKSKGDDFTVRQLKNSIAAVHGEENIFLDHFQYDLMRADRGANAELGRLLDSALAVGRRAQGIASGFYYIRRLQQQVGLRSMLYALADTFEGVNPLSPARLVDIGMSAEVAAKIKKYFVGPKKIVERLDEGMDLHLDKWDPQDAMELSSVLNRHVNQVVQKAMAGESTPWVHDSIGAVMLQAKSFALLAIEKQALRNLRIGDEAAAMGMAWCMATATAAYAAKMAFAGKLDDQSNLDLVKGGIMYSNLTGWMPQFYDPLVSALGIDSMKWSKYNIGPQGDVLGVPPVLTTMNRLAHLPASAARVVTPGVEYSNADLNALQALPIVGTLAWTKSWSELLRKD